MSIAFFRPAVTGSISVARAKHRCRRSIFTCEPRYRVLRIVTDRSHRPLRHLALSRLMQAADLLRVHSSWSRA